MSFSHSKRLARIIVEDRTIVSGSEALCFASLQVSGSSNLKPAPEALTSFHHGVRIIGDEVRLRLSAYKIGAATLCRQC